MGLTVVSRLHYVTQSIRWLRSVDCESPQIYAPVSRGFYPEDPIHQPSIQPPDRASSSKVSVRAGAIDCVWFRYKLANFSKWPTRELNSAAINRFANG